MRELLKNIRLFRILAFHFRSWRSGRSYIRGRGNSVYNKGVRVRSRIQIVGGGNSVILDAGSVVMNSLIRVQGDNNRVIIHENAYLSGAELWIEDNDCTIEIGARTFIGHHSHLACTENRNTLTVGPDCMISSYVQIRTGDSHSVLNADGERINRARSVGIGNHCWIGEGVRILKGVSLANDTIVATGSIITKSFDANVLLGGVPAKVLKANVTWDKDRL